MCSCPLWKYTRKSVNTEPTNDRRQLRYIAANVLLNCWQCNDSVMRVVEMWTMTRTHLLTVQWDTAHYRQCIMRSTTTTTTGTTILQSGNFCSRNHCCFSSATFWLIRRLVPGHSTTASWTTDHFYPSWSVLYCHFHLPPAVLEACYLHFFLQISFPTVSYACVITWNASETLKLTAHWSDFHRMSTRKKFDFSAPPLNTEIL